MPRSTRPYIVGAVTVAGASMLATTATVAQSSNEETTLTIATVDNREMVRMQELASVYEEANPGVTVEFETLGESTLRQRVITDIATDGGGYDIVTIGTYEVPIWGEREWLLPLDDMPADYNAEDLLPAISEALSYEGTQYASPFYGESTFTMYRTDLFDEAGLQMPEQPTWEFIMEAAEQLDSEDVNGVCLRGAPGWGENVALITAMANSYGARWFDDAYAPQLNSADWRNALGDYTSMLQAFGPDNASELGYNGNLELFQEGSCAIWVDATVAGSALTVEDESRVANEVGFALAPGTGLEVNSNWLWAWSLPFPRARMHLRQQRTLSPGPPRRSTPSSSPRKTVGPTFLLARVPRCTRRRSIRMRRRSPSWHWSLLSRPTPTTPRSSQFPTPAFSTSRSHPSPALAPQWATASR